MMRVTKTTHTYTVLEELHADHAVGDRRRADVLFSMLASSRWPVDEEDAFHHACIVLALREARAALARPQASEGKS
jgi:hypothetical protein